ncbi:DUF1569 domain-containing protein [Pedobacter sp. HDW13]|uniref:DUF1569 domain-containing protein n=1 Tax=Pedobacter sp. HDW13 TaxID=2714940 RepID=UPI00140A1335|nr:DUF1569 domain-containing protein [Pedobacter sp. HDW13]QIL40931.1 DUF1569 domain-containing protein [Pedobacter sp. HDW13]
MKNIFQPAVTSEIIERINTLSPTTPQLWGKMNVVQMLAHCNVTYEMIYDDIHPKPGLFMKFILKNLVKSKVVSEKSYPKNNPTAPQFIIKDERDFEKEKARLIAYLNKTQELGENHFEGKESHSFGKLNKTEWNNMFYKHLDHHLSQFGA